MSRLKYNNQSGALGGSLTNVATTITFAVAPSFATIVAPDLIPIALEPGTTNFEIIWLTAYTAGATTGTILRGQEGTTAVAHGGVAAWVHGATAQDFTGSISSYSPVFGRNWYTTGTQLSVSTLDGFGGSHYYWTGDTSDLSGGVTYDVTTGYFTVPVAGLYQLQAAIAAPNGHDWTANQQVPFVWTPNGPHFAQGVFREAWQTGFDDSVIFLILRLAAGAVVRFGINAGSGTPAPYYVTGEEYGVSIMQLGVPTSFLSGGGGDQAWVPVTYGGAWVDFDGTHAAAYRKDSLGFVHLRGLVKSGVAGTTITTLPLGYRPDNEVTCLQSRDAAATAMRVWIEPSGAVIPESVTVASYLSLDGITFYAGPPTAVALSQANEDLASILVNATSPGDTGNRSDPFLGGALGGSWASYGSASTIVVRDSALGLLNAGASSDGGVRQGYTPSGVFRVETRVRSGTLEIGGTALTGGAPSDSMQVSSPDVTSGGCQMAHRTAGVFAVLATSGISVAPGTPLYLAIERDGANNWTAYWSLDRALWVALATVTQVIGVGNIYLSRYSSGAPHSYDFIDVVT